MADHSVIALADIAEVKLIIRLAAGRVEMDDRFDSALNRKISLVLDEALEMLFLFEVDAMDESDPFVTLNSITDTEPSEPSQDARS